MHFSTSLLLACGTANLAFAATNVVFYAAYEGMNTNQGSKGCTGANLGTVKQSGAGTSACKQVGEGACVTLTGHQGDATKCKVITFEEADCGGDGDSTIFGRDGDYSNENFASFKAMCS